MRRRLRTIRARVTLVAAGVFALTFTIAAFAMVRVVDTRVHDSARSAAKTVLANVATSLLNGATPAQAAQTSLNEPVYLQIIDDDGAVINGNISAPLVDYSDGRAGATHIPGRGDHVLLTQTLRFSNGASWHIVVASSLVNAARSVLALQRTLWVLTPLLIALVAFTVWWLAGRTLAPVEAIRNEVEAISASTISRRVPEPDTDDEVARLASTMNAMLDRLESAQRRQREFVSDASHELRSPIASMGVDLEVALAHPDAIDWNDTATRVLGERDRLARLVDDLFQLARLDEGRALRRDEVDLDDLVLQEAARARRVAVDTRAVSAGRVIGDARVLEQVVRNLLDNAARHARSRVEVSVAVHTAGDTTVVVLGVDDDGNGVAPELRERIFERFARADESRARDGGGAGLGLALVQRVVGAHGGRVRCTESTLGGARFEVVLPAAS